MPKDNQHHITAFSGVKWSLFEVYGAQFATFFISIILARLLTPSDFGLVGISIGAVAVLKSFVSFGYSEALIQDQQLKNDTLNSIFVLNIVMGCLLSVLLFFMAPWIANYYEIAPLEWIIKCLSILNFIESFVRVQTALFTRALDFKILAIRKMIAQLIAGVAAIILAVKGFGVVALVVQFLINGFLSAILIWYQSNWRPKIDFHLRELVRLKPLAQYSLLTGVLNRSFKEINTFAIAKVFSPAQLGFYSRANSTLDFFISGISSAINKFLFPTLSKAQSDELRFKRTFMNVYTTSLLFVVVVTCLCFVSAHSIISLLFGNQWLESVFIFRCLLIKGVAYTHYSVVKSAILARSKVKEGYRYDNVKRILELTPLIGMVLGGFNVFLYWFMAVQVLNILIQSALVYKAIGYSYQELLQTLITNLIIFSVIVILLESCIINPNHSVFIDLIKVILAMLLILIKLYLFNKDVLLESRAVLKRILSFK